MADQPGMPGLERPVRLHFPPPRRQQTEGPPLPASGPKERGRSRITTIPRARLRDGGPHVRIEYSIPCDRPIVVECQYTELQVSSFALRVTAILHLQFRASLKELKHLAPRDHTTQAAIGHDRSGHWLPSVPAHPSMTFLASPCANELKAG